MTIPIYTSTQLALAELRAAMALVEVNQGTSDGGTPTTDSRFALALEALSPVARVALTNWGWRRAPYDPLAHERRVDRLRGGQGPRVIRLPAGSYHAAVLGGGTVMVGGSGFGVMGGTGGPDRPKQDPIPSVGGTASAAIPGGRRFAPGLTLRDFIQHIQHEQSGAGAYYLGVASNGALEVYQEGVVSTRPSYCQVRMVVGEHGGPSFFMYDSFQGPGQEWVPLRPQDWSFPGEGASDGAKFIVESMRSLVQNILINEVRTRIRPGLEPRTYGHRIDLLYQLYRVYQRMGVLNYFYEMMQLAEPDDGGVYTSYVDETSGRREDLMHFAQRLSHTMGFDEFVLVMGEGHVVRAFPGPETTATEQTGTCYKLTVVSPGVFSVEWRREGAWQTLDPSGVSVEQALGILDPDQFIDSTSNVAPISRPQVDPITRYQVGSLLTLALRGVQFAPLRRVMDGRDITDFEGYIEGLLRYSVTHPFYMDFMYHHPCDDVAQPERRFLTAFNQLFDRLFRGTLTRYEADPDFKPYGASYLRYAMRVYMAERVRRYLRGSFSPLLAQDRGGQRPNSEKLNQLSSRLMDIATGTGAIEQIANPVMDELVALAREHKDQREFFPGGHLTSQEAFIDRAQDISETALYLTDDGGEPS